MIIGFTGTRSGMSDNQRKEIEYYLSGYKTTDKKYAIHGGCIGADIDFHNLCKSYNYNIEVYPGHSEKNPNDLRFRGEYLDADVINESQTYLKRNRDIVDKCDILLATPYDNSGKGGTWYTIKYANKIGKEVIIINR